MITVPYPYIYLSPRRSQPAKQLRKYVTHLLRRLRVCGCLQFTEPSS